MPVYDVIEIIGSSSESWEKAAANAVEQKPPNLSASFASQKSKNSICNWTRRERWRPIARRSNCRSNMRTPEPKRAWYTAIELDTHDREAVLPAVTLIREDRTPRGKCCASSLSIRSDSREVRVPFMALSGPVLQCRDVHFPGSTGRGLGLLKCLLMTGKRHATTGISIVKYAFGRLRVAEVGITATRP
jgi:hypothetical protein